MKTHIENLILIVLRSAALLVLCVLFMGHSPEAKAQSGQASEYWGNDNCLQYWDGAQYQPSSICRYFAEGDTAAMFEQYDKNNYYKPAVHVDYGQATSTGWVYAYTGTAVIAVPWRGSFINVFNVELQSVYFRQDDGSWITIPQIQALIAQKIAAQSAAPQYFTVGGGINWDDPVMKLAALIDKFNGIQD
jgi:hypothetical protein